MIKSIAYEYVIGDFYHNQIFMRYLIKEHRDSITEYLIELFETGHVLKGLRELEFYLGEICDKTNHVWIDLTKNIQERLNHTEANRIFYNYQKFTQEITKKDLAFYEIRDHWFKYNSQNMNNLSHKFP